MKDEEKTFFICNFRFVICDWKRSIERDFSMTNDKSKITNEKCFSFILHPSSTDH
jgi:hypothetical protein